MIAVAAPLAAQVAPPPNPSAKVHPRVRAEAAAGGYIPVLIVLPDQPQAAILDRAERAESQRIETARRIFVRTAQQSPFSDAQVRQARAAYDDLLLQVRRGAFAEIEAAIRPGQDAAQTRLLALGARELRRFTAINLIAAEVPAAAIETLAADSAIAEVAPDRRHDALLDISAPALGAAAFWNAGYTGLGQDVALFDSGVAFDHPALAGRIENRIFLAGNQCPGDTKAIAEDRQGHGTHVAGIIAGAGSSECTTCRGVARGLTRLLNVKVACKNSSGGASSFDSDVIAGLEWLVQNTTVKIVNYSYGASPLQEPDLTRSEVADISARFWDWFAGAYGLTVVIAAGNDGNKPGCEQGCVSSPGTAYNAITVANVNDAGTAPRTDDVVYATSSRGPVTRPWSDSGPVQERMKPDIAAPGTLIRSTSFTWNTNGHYENKTGTSMAAPHIAGAAALIRSAGVTDPLAIKALLLNTADANAWDPAYGWWKRDWGWGYANLDRLYQQRQYTFTGSAQPAEFRFFAGDVAGPPLRATLTWNRRFLAGGATQWTNVPYLQDLNLSVYAAAGGRQLAAAEGVPQNVEQVQVDLAGRMVVKVNALASSGPGGTAPESFGLALSHPGFEAKTGPRFSLACSAPQGIIPNASFQVACTGSNTGDLAAFAVKATLSAPAGFAGAGAQNLGDLAAGAGFSRSWTLAAPASAGTHDLVVSLESVSYGETFSHTFVLTVPVVPACTIALATTPPGLATQFDGQPYAGPVTVACGSTHTVGTVSPQPGAGGTRFVWSSWSGGGGQSHTIAAPASGSATYTAAFATEYLLTLSAQPAAGGSVSPASGNYYSAGAAVAISATANAGYRFVSWTGGAAAAGSASTSVSMTGPRTLAANFELLAAPDLTVSKSHSGNFRQGDTGAVYTITVRNAGNASTAGTVAVAESVPTGLMAVAMAGAGWNCNSAAWSCTRGDALAAGASYPPISLTVSVAVNAPASVTNVVTVSGGGEFNTGNNSAADVTTVAPGSANPFVQQGSKLVRTGSTWPSAPGQGETVAVSSDGGAILLSGPPGSAFLRSGGAWIAQGGELRAVRIAVSGNGSTAVLSGSPDFPNGAWILTRSGGVWTQGPQLPVGGACCSSVAVSADGNTAILGNDSDSGGMGAAWVFVRSANGWIQQGGKLVGSGAVGAAAQGSSVALSSGGNTAIVGGPGDNNSAGAAWIFTRASGVWTQQAKLVGSGGLGAASSQGAAVALSAEGDTAIVGGHTDDSMKGAAWVFTRSSGTWTQQAKLVGTGASGQTRQGRSAALSADGNTAAVGGSGAVWVYARSGGVWSQLGNPLVGTGAAGAANQGVSVAMSGDGNTIVVGGSGDNNSTGAAWVFSRTAAAAGSSAQFLFADTATRGTWKHTYGAAGAQVLDGLSALPVSLTLSGALEHTWAASTADERGLQKLANATERVAKVWYTPGQMTVDLQPLVAGQVHQLAVYCLDWDNLGRSQTIEVLNPSGAVLDARPLSNFSGGVWAVWTFTGNVRLRVTRVAGPNAVISGLMFGGASAAAVAVAVNPAAVALRAGETQTFTATVSNTANTSVTWSLAPAVGSIDGAGRYIAPAAVSAIQTVVVTATSQADAAAKGTAAITLMPPVQAGQAQFSALDATTQGDWKGRYGTDGYIVVNDAVSNPAYVVPAPSGNLSHTWAAATADGRALAKAGAAAGRIAAVWYTSGQMTVDLPLTGSQARTLAVYCLDWDFLGRVQTLELLNASGTVLDSRTLSGFGGGVWAVWAVSGSVRLRVTRIAGPNAVVSGLMFGASAPPPVEPPPSGQPGQAQFSGSDSNTKGNWKSAYGSEGYVIVNDAASNPSYVTPSASGQQSHTWASSTADARALLKAASAAGRIAAVWYTPGQMTVDLPFTGSQSRQIAAYFLDWDSLGRVQTVEVLSGTGTVLDTRTVSDFSGGVWMVWSVGGHVRLRVTRVAGPNAVIGGLMFGGAPPAGSADTPSQAQFAGFDASTRGNWKGVYGGGGYVVVNNAAVNAPYVTPSPGGNLSHTWAADTADERALLKAGAAAGRIAAVWYTPTQMFVDLPFTGAQTRQIAVYCLDWDFLGRVQTIEVLSAAGDGLDTRTLSNFGGGVWALWNVSGPVRLRVTRLAGANAVLSGLMF